MYVQQRAICGSHNRATDHQMLLDWADFLESKSEKVPLAFNLQHDKSRKRAACMNMLTHIHTHIHRYLDTFAAATAAKHKFPLTINLKEITLK